MSGYRDHAHGYRFNANASEFCPKFPSSFQREGLDHYHRHVDDRVFRNGGNFNRGQIGIPNQNRYGVLRNNTPISRHRYPSRPHCNFPGNMIPQRALPPPPPPHFQRPPVQRFPSFENYKWSTDNYNPIPFNVGLPALKPGPSMAFPRSSSNLDQTLSLPVNGRDTFNMSDADKLKEISFLCKKLAEDQSGPGASAGRVQTMLMRNFDQCRTGGQLQQEPLVTNQSSEHLLNKSLFRGINGVPASEEPPLLYGLQKEASVSSQDRPACSSYQSLEQTSSQPLNESQKDAPQGFLDLKAVIVHFIGCDSKSKRAEKDFSLRCKDGEVKANREVLCTTSSFFFKNIVPSSVSLDLPYLEAHSMKLIVLLVSLGRVAILHKRLKAFMKLVAYLSIKGVFSSEDEPVSPDITILTGNQSLAVEELGQAYVDVQQPLGLAPKVKCLECKNVFLKSMFNLHHREYHSRLEVKEKCCNESFSTRYELVNHKKTSCLALSGRQAALSDISGISVNLNVERPYTNTHSTPI